MGGRDTIDFTLEDWMEVFFKVGMGDPGRRCGRDCRAGRAVGGDGEVCKERGRCVYSGIHACGCCGGGVDVWLTWCSLIEIFGVGLEYLHIVEVSMWGTKVLRFWWSYHTILS